MTPTFDSLVEQVRTRTPEELEELKAIINRKLIAERRREFKEDSRQAQRELKRGKLKFSSSVSELMKSLED